MEHPVDKKTRKAGTKDWIVLITLSKDVYTNGMPTLLDDQYVSKSSECWIGSRIQSVLPTFAIFWPNEAIFVLDKFSMKKQIVKVGNTA